jgi:Flp pilus assembly pilin Flp
MKVFMEKVRAFARNEDGASLAEYAILLLIASVVTAGLVFSLREAIDGNITDATTAVNYTE